MNKLPRLVSDLVEGIPLDVGSEAEGLAVVVDALEVELPVETRLTRDPRFSAPRRRTRTGFDRPLARITLGLVRREG